MNLWSMEKWYGEFILNEFIKAITFQIRIIFCIIRLLVGLFSVTRVHDFEKTHEETETICTNLKQLRGLVQMGLILQE